ncbi:FAD-dependent oxidoreductase [Paenibacillus sp. P26]|nr:FAD-dependent oxidoreductase [Paenibacillus sp. P26]
MLSVDPEQKLVKFADDEPLSYDYLVIALGCVDKYHGIPGAEEYSNSIQTLSSTRKTYQVVNDVKPYGQISIVGGGLSGVEMAAELRESRPDLNIRIIDRGPSVLSPFPEKLQKYVREWMLEHDIELRSHVSLCRVEPGLLYNQEELIHTDMTIWTAGIQPSPIVQQLNLPKDNQGRLTVNEYHQLPDYNDIYVIGDCASLPFAPSGQLAEAAGKQVAEVLQAIWKNETPRLGKIKLKGVLGSLGKKAGFGLMGKRTIMLGMVPRALKSGVLWMSKHHLG